MDKLLKVFVVLLLLTGYVNALNTVYNQYGEIIKEDVCIGDYVEQFCMIINQDLSDVPFACTNCTVYLTLTDKQHGNNIYSNVSMVHYGNGLYKYPTNINDFVYIPKVYDGMFYCNMPNSNLIGSSYAKVFITDECSGNSTSGTSGGESAISDIANYMSPSNFLDNLLKAFNSAYPEKDAGSIRKSVTGLLDTAYDSIGDIQDSIAQSKELGYIAREFIRAPALTIADAVIPFIGGIFYDLALSFFGVFIMIEFFMALIAYVSSRHIMDFFSYFIRYNYTLGLQIIDIAFKIVNIVITLFTALLNFVATLIKFLPVIGKLFG